MLNTQLYEFFNNSLQLKNKSGKLILYLSEGRKIDIIINK